jgi:hypothetical protein
MNSASIEGGFTIVSIARRARAILDDPQRDVRAKAAIPASNAPSGKGRHAGDGAARL